MSDINATTITFSDLGLPEDILHSVTQLGFMNPTAIQAQAIPHLLAGRDVLGVAQTGTGKTAAFGLPLLAHIDPNLREVQALVLAPTRELAMQGAEALSSFAARCRDIDIVAVYGGSSYTPQLRALKNGAQVVVGTPGRIIDLMERDALRLDNVHYFVLDEADEMLRMGFAEDVETIAHNVPAERISALFSATMPPAIRRVADQHLSEPEEVTISRPASTVATIHQTYSVVPHAYKTAALARVLGVSQAEAVLVFVATRAMAEELSLDLTARGIQAAALSGDVAQKEREKLVDRLRNGQLDVIVATDVAARGLDVERIGLVVNYDVPRESDTYVHRIGRTGRAGREGEALTFVTAREIPRLRRIQKATKATMEEVPVPSASEVARFKAERLIDRAHKRSEAGSLDIYSEVLDSYRVARENAYEAFDNEEFNPDVESVHSFLSDSQLLAALIALGVRDDSTASEGEPEFITADEPSSKKNKKKGKECKERRMAEGATRYRLEVGHRDKVRPGAIVGALTNEGGLNGKVIGHIDIYPTFSLVDISGDIPDEIWGRISQARVSGRKLRISRDRGPLKKERDDDFASDIPLGRRAKPKRNRHGKDVEKPHYKGKRASTQRAFHARNAKGKKAGLAVKMC